MFKEEFKFCEFLTYELSDDCDDIVGFSRMVCRDTNGEYFQGSFYMYNSINLRGGGIFYDKALNQLYILKMANSTTNKFYELLERGTKLRNTKFTDAPTFFNEIEDYTDCSNEYLAVGKESLLALLEKCIHAEFDFVDDKDYLRGEIIKKISEIKLANTEEKTRQTTTNNTNTNIERELRGEETMTNVNVNEMIKTGINGEVLLRGKNGDFFKITENGTLARELYCFDNINAIQQKQVPMEHLKKFDVVLFEGKLSYVFKTSKESLELVDVVSKSKTTMVMEKADGMNDDFTLLTNPIKFQIEELNAKARDLLATVPSNVPKLQLQVQFASADNMEMLAKSMMAFVEGVSKQNTTTKK